MPKRSTVKKGGPVQKKASKAPSKRAAHVTAIPPAAPPPLQSRPHPGRPQAAAPAQPPTKKPGYYEAIAIYEKAVRSLQRHDYTGAADQFRNIIERYPDERELQERSRLYLRVCERETARRPVTPRTPEERVYAATVALNAGDHAGALDLLRAALSEAPDSDHAHYILAVALASGGQLPESVDHLRRAIELNPDNRSLARQDPDLEAVRDLELFRAILEPPGGSPKPRPAPSAARRR